jgi:hypothetical protein
MRFTLFKQLWRLVFVPRAKLYDYRRGEQLDGVCAVPQHPGHVLTADQRVIHLRNDLDDEDLMETVIHELGHAAFVDRQEEYVEHFARDTARLLTRLGFRRKGTDDAA